MINRNVCFFYLLHAGLEQIKEAWRLQSILYHKPGVFGLLLTDMHLSFLKLRHILIYI